VLEMAGSDMSGFFEKPVHEFWVSTGIYVFSRAVLEHIPAEGPFGFDQLMHRLLERQVPVGIYPFHGYWLDIGRPEDFERANEDVHRLEVCPDPVLPFPPGYSNR
jgi:NDP-mannose synthase